MESFGSGLYRMLLKLEVIRMQDNEYAVMIFAVGCAIIGILAVVADVSFFILRGESLLGLRHSLRNTLIFVFAWGIGALVIGYLGEIANIFQVSLLACTTVGVGWPLVFTQILERNKEEVQNPTEES